MSQCFYVFFLHTVCYNHDFAVLPIPSFSFFSLFIVQYLDPYFFCNSPNTVFTSFPSLLLLVVPFVNFVLGGDLSFVLRGRQYCSCLILVPSVIEYGVLLSLKSWYLTSHLWLFAKNLSQVWWAFIFFSFHCFIARFHIFPPIAHRTYLYVYDTTNTIIYFIRSI